MLTLLSLADFSMSFLPGVDGRAATEFTFIPVSTSSYIPYTLADEISPTERNSPKDPPSTPRSLAT
jgi:hypothetical protein